MGRGTEFFYASTLGTGTSGGYIIPRFVGTAASQTGTVKKVRITGLKATCGASGRTIRIASENGSSKYKPIKFTLQANSTHDFNWPDGYPLNVIATSSAPKGIYASAAGAGVDVVISGYVENNSK